MTYDALERLVNMKNLSKKLAREVVGGEPYEFYPIGRHIVIAPGICGGRPTFKYTRIDVRHALGLLGAGRTIEAVASAYNVPVKAVREALSLAARAFDERGAELTRRA